MGLHWLARHLGGLIVWTLIITTLALTITAIVGASVGNVALANNTGAGAFLTVLAGGIYGGGYAVARRSQRTTRLDHLEQSVADIQTRVTRVEDEQLADVADTLASMERILAGDRDNVATFRRGS